MLNVQYGCGLSAPEGWLNYDASPRLRVERLPIIGIAMRQSGRALFPANVRYGDIVTGLPLADGSVDALYCSHILEHIDRASVEIALANSHRLLRPGAPFRLIVPDLLWRARKFVTDHEAGIASAADEFMYSCYLGEERPSRTVMAKLRALLGNSAHRWMFDAPQMKALLARAGFTDIRDCRFGDSEVEAFKQVEDEGRFIDTGHAEVALEARKAQA